MANTFTVGDLEVLVVSDGSSKVPATAYFAGTTREQWAPHARWLDHDGNVVMPFTCFLVRSGDRRILIDTGLGPVKLWNFTGGDLLNELATAGVKPEEIETVFITHLHVDHCGNVALPSDGVLQVTFPNATYHWTLEEDAYWHSTKPLMTDFSMDAMFEAVAPRFQPVEDGATLAPGINVISLPGHTPGQAGVVLSSGAERAFILGDAISCPAQVEQSEWSGMGDVDPKLARRTQEALAQELEGTDALVAATHFPGLTFGRVLRGEGRRYWQPL